ncbi:MAG: SH3 domain-containing protein [Pseudomonadota bacterium]|nr:SH3 domain-containing protein [Pseudomonadota bacterium]
MHYFSLIKRSPVSLLWVVLALLAGCTTQRLAHTTVDALPQGTFGVPGVSEAQLDPGFWIQRQPAADTLLLDADAVAARNAELFAQDASMHDLAAMPATLSAAQVRKWIEGMSSRPTRILYDRQGQVVPASILDTLAANLALAAIPASQPTRFGLVVARAPMRSFPTLQRVFSRTGDTDIDRWQESAEFPGTPLVIAHASADGKWLFVISPRYAAWMPAQFVAEGQREDVLAYYTNQGPYRVITGAKPRLVYTPDNAALSELQLDMGTRLPDSGTTHAATIQSQAPAFHWTVSVPLRFDDGKLGFALALLPRSEDSHLGPLPLTRANIIGQAFKFLGERYGWGHDYNSRDCSGFVSEVYASMGLILPRNTSAQAVSPVFQRTHFETGDARRKRVAAVDRLDVGDLIFIPGHVMMYIGRIGDTPYVIHDTNGGTVLDANGVAKSLKLNGVSVTPLTALRFDAESDYIDRITNIVRVVQTSSAADN